VCWLAHDELECSVFTCDFGKDGVEH
jgi:hypothetical protein